MRKIISSITGALLLFSASVMAFAAGNLPVIKVNGREFFYYEVKSGDSLYGLTKTYGWNTDTLRVYNSDIDGQMRKGRKIYYPVAPKETPAVKPVKPVKPLTPAPPLRDTVTNKPTEVKPEVKTGEAPAPTFFYTIREGDTLFALAREYDTSVASIEALNPGLKEEQLRIGSVIRLAKGNGSASLVSQQPTEPAAEADVPRQGPVQVTLLLPEPQSKRDIDFLRGFVLGIDELGVPREKINVSVIDCGTDASSVLTDPRLRNADLAVTTYDKDFPELLSETCSDFDVPLVNVFDVKTNQYERNPEFIQLLPPTDVFNSLIADETARRFAGSTFLFVGADTNPDPESMTASLLEVLSDKDITLFTLANNEALASYNFDPATHYVVVADYSKRADAEKLVETINGKNKLTGADIAVFGRPNWVVFADRLKERSHNTEIFIPSRFYFDSSDPLSTEFSEQFNAAYDQKPVRSFPMYAVMGHDVAASFIAPLAAGNSKDLAAEASRIRPLQLPVNLQRTNGDKSGYVNNGAMFVHIRPEGTIEIIDIR